MLHRAVAIIEKSRGKDSPDLANADSSACSCCTSFTGTSTGLKPT